MDKPKTFEIKLTAKQQEDLKTYLFENPDVSLRQTLNQAIDTFLTDYFNKQETNLSDVNNINDPKFSTLLHLIDSRYNSSEDPTQCNALQNALKEYQVKNSTSTSAQIIYDIFKTFHKRFFQNVFYENGQAYIKGRTGNNAPCNISLGCAIKESKIC